ncbi:TPA: signal peptidase II [Clostridioides difficile]|nr:signal peptidase II [Clostridioides difficile]
MQGGVNIRQVKSFVFPVIVLIFLDQISKALIGLFLMDFEFDIIGKFLRFNPVQNTNLSYGGNFIGILSNLWVLVLFNILVILVIISGYAFYKSKNEQTSYSVKVIMSCGLAGAICSLIDKVFWGGSLDFLQIPSFFIFDLKDCYLTVAEIIFVIIGILHNKEISMKEYIYFCYHQFRR